VYFTVSLDVGLCHLWVALVIKVEMLGRSVLDARADCSSGNN
jgi:hypothetical protein